MAPPSEEPAPPPLVPADKVDLLVMIDNSASMGDKQAILADAVPNLLGGLLTPKCLDPSGRPDASGRLADPSGSKENNFGCPDGTAPEFRPVTDLHIGVISSSLGSFGGDVCPDAAPTNDRAHLLTRVKEGGTLPEAAPSSFLSWFPSNAENADPSKAINDLTTLSASFQKLVIGVEQSGCGLEAQLESVYRFLIQPDPWVKVTVDSAKQADLGGAADIDLELLQQRADFLREDSLVAIVALTDEDDSSADPLSLGGQGWGFMASQFPASTVFRTDGKTTTAPRATSVCATDPNSPDCTSCGFAATCSPNDPACEKIKADPECQKNGGYYGETEEPLNVRFHRMKQRFGVDPQYPIRRYVDGLTKFKVPDRSTEHAATLRVPADPSKGRDIKTYEGTAKCTNPLFARNLPRHGTDELCKLPRSTRSPGLVFFAVVGGVPSNLLHFNASDPEKNVLTTDDWAAIVGRDPANFDFEGIDPHMIASVAARPGIPPPSDTRGDNGSASDPVGRDWNTRNDDLQYACTFTLPVPRECTAEDPSCDCGGTKNPPLCAQQGQQIKGKAYPTLRELMVVRALGAQGVAASLCPITLSGSTQAPEYGYNPAVLAILERVRPGLVR